MHSLALFLAFVVFAAVSALHFVRYHKDWEVTVNHFVVPKMWSIYGGVVTAVLALIMLMGMM